MFTFWEPSAQNKSLTYFSLWPAQLKTFSAWSGVFVKYCLANTRSVAPSTDSKKRSSVLSSSRSPLMVLEGFVGNLSFNLWFSISVDLYQSSINVSLQCLCITDHPSPCVSAYFELLYWQSSCFLCSWEDVASWGWESGSRWPRETSPPCHHPFPPCQRPTCWSQWEPLSWWLAAWAVLELSKRAVLCCWRWVICLDGSCFCYWL